MVNITYGLITSGSTWSDVEINSMGTVSVATVTAWAGFWFSLFFSRFCVFVFVAFFVGVVLPLFFLLSWSLLGDISPRPSHLEKYAGSQ